MNNRFVYYCDYFTDRNGVRHCTVNIYDTLSSNVQTLNDLRFN